MFPRFKGMLTTMDQIKVWDDISNVQCRTHLFIKVLCRHHHDGYAGDHCFMVGDTFT